MLGAGKTDAPDQEIVSLRAGGRCLICTGTLESAPASRCHSLCAQRTAGLDGTATPQTPAGGIHMHAHMAHLEQTRHALQEIPRMHCRPRTAHQPCTSGDGWSSTADSWGTRCTSQAAPEMRRRSQQYRATSYSAVARHGLLDVVGSYAAALHAVHAYRTRLNTPEHIHPTHHQAVFHLQGAEGGEVVWGPSPACAAPPRDATSGIHAAECTSPAPTWPVESHAPQ